MNSGPTLTKLILLIAFITVIYFLFALPLFSGAYMALKSGNLSNFTSLLSNKLKVF